MAVKRALYDKVYDNYVSPVITAGTKKNTSNAGPGVSSMTKSPEPAATIVKPGQQQSSSSPVITVGKGPGSREESGSYLTGYQPGSFSTSGRTDDYYDKLQDLEASKPGDFVSSYKPDIDKIIDSIMNRPKFETDDVFDSDLYKTYREQYINQGQKAMRDATGNAAAATGGYGSTYAAAVGQQAYDGYLSQLGDKSLDIYDRVYNQYLQEGQELYNQLGMLNNQDSIDYGRYRDTVSDYYNDLGYYAGRYDSEYGKDFGEYQTDQAAQQWAEQYAYQKTQDALGQQNWQTQMEYQKQQDALAQQNWQAQFDYQKQIDAQQMALAASRASGGGRTRSSGSSYKTSASNSELIQFAKDLLNEKDNRGGATSKSYYINDASTTKNILMNYFGIDEKVASSAVAEAQKESKNKTDNSYTYRKAR